MSVESKVKSNKEGEVKSDDRLSIFGGKTERQVFGKYLKHTLPNIFHEPQTRQDRFRLWTRNGTINLDHTCLQYLEDVIIRRNYPGLVSGSTQVNTIYAHQELDHISLFVIREDRFRHINTTKTVVNSPESIMFPEPNIELISGDEFIVALTLPQVFDDGTVFYQTVPVRGIAFYGST